MGKKKLLICPQCKLLHESGDVCIRCRVALVAPEAAQQEEPKAVTAPLENEIPSSEPPFQLERAEAEVSPEVQTPYGSGSAYAQVSPGCGNSDPASEMPEPETSSLSPGANAEAPDLHETSHPGEMPPASQESTLKPGRIRGKSMALRVGLAAGVLLLLVGVGYFVMGPSLRNPSASVEASGASSPGPVLLPLSSQPNPSDQEIAQINGLFDNIRKANLQENIDLFMSCYAPDFNEREAKKSAALQTWDEIDYLELSYQFKDQNVAEDVAHIRVEWSMKISSTPQAPPEKSTVLLKATLVKKNGDWKISKIEKAS